MTRLLLLSLLLVAGCRDLGFRPPPADNHQQRAPRCLVSGTFCGTNDDCCSGRCDAPGNANGPPVCR